MLMWLIKFIKVVNLYHCLNVIVQLVNFDRADCVN